MQLGIFNMSANVVRIRRQRRKRKHTQQGHDEAGVFVGCKAQILFAVDSALIIKLDLFAAECLAQLQQGFALRVVVCQSGRNRLYQGEALQQHGKFAQRAVKTDGARRHFLRFCQQGFAVLVDDTRQQFVQILLVHRTYHLADVLFGNATRTHSDGLVEQAQGITHRACGGTAQELQGGGFVGDVFVV